MTMDEIDKKQLYNTAWNHWGSNMQLDILIEEMAEFTQAILKARRNGVTYSYSFYEEMADVLICMEQVETRLKDFPDKCDYDKHVILSTCWDRVMEIKEKKLLRLKERLFDDTARDAEGIVGVE